METLISFRFSKKSQAGSKLCFLPSPKWDWEPVLEGLQGLWLPMGPSKYKGLRSCISILWSSIISPHPFHCRATGKRLKGSLRTSACTTIHCSLQGSQGHTEETFPSMSYCLGLQKATEHHWNLGTRHKQKGLIKITRSVESILQL